jgi:hypothetical protein
MAVERRGVDLQQILDADQAEDVVEVFLVDGNREYSCSRKSARRSATLAFAWIATMSGRGVITSRDERVAEIDDRLQQAALVPFDQPLLSPASR